MNFFFTAEYAKEHRGVANQIKYSTLIAPVFDIYPLTPPLRHSASSTVQFT